MKNAIHGRRRRAMPALAVATLAAAALSGSTAVATASTQVATGQSENWAGYVAEKTSSGSRFSTVSGSWVQPSVDAASGQGYSAFWVGLGGASSSSQALEQVGTEADTENGRAEYFAWYELVPKAPVKLKLPIHAGDHISARVTVRGTAVVVTLSDTTTGRSQTKTLHMSHPDTTSAEWIAEAPAEESSNGDFAVLPLADFGKVSFAAASATAGGHTGSIDDARWTTERVNLVSGAGSAGPGGRFDGRGFGGGVQSSSAGATTSSLSSAGRAFSVSDAATSTSTDSTGGYGGYHGYGAYGPGAYGAGGDAYSGYGV